MDPTPERERPSAGESSGRPWLWGLLLVLVGAGGYLTGRLEPKLPERWARVLAELPGGLDRFVIAEGSDAPGGSAVPDGEDRRAALMEYVQGDGQEAEPGVRLPEPFVVMVRDADGDPVEGVEVLFDALAGGGAAVPQRAVTDAQGRASTRWRLGGRAGFQRLAATSPGIDTPVTFTAIARGAEAEIASAPVGASGPQRASTPVDASGAGTAPTSTAGATPVVPVPGEEPEADVPERPRPVVVHDAPFTVGGATVCMVANARVTCRGSDDRGQRVTGGVQGSRAVAAGLFHVCALVRTGEASCWGANNAGQLGDGSRVDREVPTRVDTALRFSTLSAGAEHTCGVTAEGSLACWGRNLNGQLGDGSRDDRATPLPTHRGRFDTVVAGWQHTCASTPDGTAHCWGLNRDGQVGDGSRLDRLAPVRVLASVDALAAGSAHTCAISGDAVLCWGANGFGQLGDGTTDARLHPTPVTGLPGRARALVAGAAHTCALMADGAAYCWGQNLHGQLGDGSTTSRTSPVPVAGGLTFEELHAGGGVTCGRAPSGVAYCWGLNQSGQLGDGTLTNRPAPVRVSE